MNYLKDKHYINITCVFTIKTPNSYSKYFKIFLRMKIKTNIKIDTQLLSGPANIYFSNEIIYFQIVEIYNITFFYYTINSEVFASELVANLEDKCYGIIYLSV